MEKNQSNKPPRLMKELGYAALEVKDLQKSKDFYTRVCNLVVTYEDRESVYLRSQFEHHCLALYQGSESRLRHISFETRSDEDSEALLHLLQKLNIPTREAPEIPGRLGKSFQFQDIDGTWVEIYRAMSRMPNPISQRAFHIERLGHYTMMTTDVQKITNFYKQIGFRLSDLDPLGSWLRCNTDHHGLAFLQAEKITLHHHAYDIKDWGQIKLILDWLFAQGVAPEAGPVRHAAGNNIALYVKDPDGFRMEFYCDLEKIYDDEHHERHYPVQFFDLWSRKGAPEGFRN